MSIESRLKEILDEIHRLNKSGESDEVKALRQKPIDLLQNMV